MVAKVEFGTVKMCVHLLVFNEESLVVGEDGRYSGTPSLRDEMVERIRTHFFRHLRNLIFLGGTPKKYQSHMMTPRKYQFNPC